MNLTEHFTLEEFIASDTATACGIPNDPPPDVLEELTKTAELMEEIRLLCGGNPVLISSGYRCSALNQEIGGASNSAHLYGCAADFTIPAFGPPLAVCQELELALMALGIDQLILENDSWVHVGRACPGAEPRHQCLTITGGQTWEGFG